MCNNDLRMNAQRPGRPEPTQLKSVQYARDVGIESDTKNSKPGGRRARTLKV